MLSIGVCRGMISKILITPQGFPSSKQKDLGSASPRLEKRKTLVYPPSLGVWYFQKSPQLGVAENSGRLRKKVYTSPQLGG